MMRGSTSHQQYNQNDQQDRAETAADIRTAVIESATAKQNHQNDNKEDEVHESAPVRNHCCAEAIAIAHDMIRMPGNEVIGLVKQTATLA
jgi:hypothetical protein